MINFFASTCFAKRNNVCHRLYEMNVTSTSHDNSSIVFATQSPRRVSIYKSLSTKAIIAPLSSLNLPPITINSSRYLFLLRKHIKAGRDRQDGRRTKGKIERCVYTCEAYYGSFKTTIATTKSERPSS